MTTLLDCLHTTEQRLTAARVDTPRLDAELLVCRALKIRREGLLRTPERNLNDAETAALNGLVKRREAREPLAYILGEREFWSLDFMVTPAVLIPRPETERLMEELLLRIEPARRREPWLLLDLCTGCGALAVAAATELPRADVVATDFSLAALNVARANAERHGVEDRIDWIRSDLYQALAPAGCRLGGFDFILCNPPYLSSSERAGLPPEIQNFEPGPALDGGPDGCGLYPRLVTGANDWLKPGGCLLLEIGGDQGPAVQAVLLNHGGFDEIGVRPDYAGRDRVALARRRMNG